MSTLLEVPIEQRQCSAKELASMMGRHITYVYAMKARGFLMPGGRASLSEARGWLVRNPAPRATTRNTTQ